MASTCVRRLPSEAGARFGFADRFAMARFRMAPVFIAALATAAFAPVQAAHMRVTRHLTAPSGGGTAASQRRTNEATRAQIGSGNTVTADPPVPRPNEPPCVAKLFTHATFAQYAPKTFAYAPPADCPGPFAKIVFNADFSVSAGRQFDRTASVELGNVPLYFGTTAEPRASLSPAWHVERDVTDDAALLALPQPGEADIFNIVDSTYTGVISASAYLQFYRASGTLAAARTPDVVLPVPNSAGGPQHLPTGTSTLTATYALPTNVERAYLDVYMQSQQTDEQYFLCAPSDIAAELAAFCPNTAFRETEISLDGTPAGVAPVYPWIFTGGLDPYLWAPLPGVQTLNFVPYRVDLTPFAATLANGKTHTIALSVDNANNYFQGFATLFAYVDRGSSHVTGALTRDTLAANPIPTVVENVTGTPPSVNGTVLVTNTRNYVLEGYVRTSHGRVATSLASTLAFSNSQQYSNQSATTGTIVANQGTTDATTVVTRGLRGTQTVVTYVSYPLSVSLASQFDASITGSQTTTIDQRFIDVRTDSGPAGFFASLTSNEVAPSDILDVTNGAISGHTDQKSQQRYAVFDSRGTCYTQTLTAANSILTGVSNAPCDRSSAERFLRAVRDNRSPGN